MKPSIAEVLRRIRPLAPVHKAAHLSALIHSEPKRGIRRAELIAALKYVNNVDLEKANKIDKRQKSKRERVA